MKRKIKAMWTVSFLMISGFAGILNFGSENAQAPTNVSGIQYDGSGGPWNLTGSPYTVIGDVTVPTGETLTIEPGVQVKFDGYYRIIADGNLTAVGLDTSRIIMTSNMPFPSPGDWGSIKINSTGRVEIIYCDISYGFFGIDIEGSSNNTIANTNIFFNDFAGISIWLSSNNTITNNGFSNNSWFGLDLWDTTSNTITGNNFTNNGIFISGNKLSHFNSHDISTNNTVNGKPLYYYKDCSGFDIDGISIGQLILANCKDINVKNLEINNTDVGIEVAYSSNITIIGNNLSNNWGSIHLETSLNNHIINNNVSSSYYFGLGLWSSTNNVISNNNISSNNFIGINIVSSLNNVIIDNDILSNGLGISARTSSNNTIISNNASNNGMGIDFYYSWNNTILNNTASYNVISQGIRVAESDYNRFENNTLMYNENNGIYLYNSTHNRIIGNNASYNLNFHGISIEESNFNYIANNNVTSNYFQGIWVGFSQYNTLLNNTLINNSHSGIYLDFATYNAIIKNNATNSIVFNGISIAMGGNNYIANNTAISNNENGIALWSSNNNIIEYNNASDNLNYDGVYLGNSDKAVIKDNTVTNNSGVGISLWFSDYANIENNNLSLNVEGIRIDKSNFLSIESNRITNNSLGIVMMPSSNTTIRENMILNNSLDGISIKGDDNYIVNNNFSSNLNGIELAQGFSNTIAYNNITSNNNLGINVTGVSINNNQFHHNNFINNTYDHAEDGYSNFWNTNCEGNYWDNWTGPDIDFNGIVDLPYNISGGGNKDYYPLTSPAVFRHTAPPTNITVRLEGPSLENVNITWDLSIDEGSCNNIIQNYAVYYGSIYGSEGKGYSFLAEVPNGTTYYVHGNAGKGDSNTYFYFVQVNDSCGYGIKNDTQVAKFNRELDVGMHLISVPLILENETLDFALQTLKYDTVWYYNNTDLFDPWKSYSPLKMFNDLMIVNRTMALWVNVTEGGNLTMVGIVPKATSIELKQGWNFVGYPSFIERTVAETLSVVNYERIEGYSQSPPEYLRIYSDGDFMIAGYGYWLKVSTDATWTLTN